MSMTKVFGAGSWAFDQPVVQMIKVSSKGLRGSDYTSLVKRAGHHFADQFRDFKCAADQVPMHVIAMGATERWGPNRNGDGFKEATLRDQIHTFISKPLTKQGAYWYRNHKNKDPLKSYGIVKDAWYNPDMQRAELMVLLNAEKSAADRNGFGLVADKEIEKIARDEDIPVSMACRVAFDKCAYCHHEARTRAEYCDSAMCKAGGCRDNLAKVVKVGNDMFHMYVENPNANFFDISNVLRGADRTAYAGVADYIQKAAADGYTMGGAELAEKLGCDVPLSVALEVDTADIFDENIRVQVKLAYGLALYEATCHHDSLPPLHPDESRAFDSRLRGPIEADPSMGGFNKAATALADEEIVLDIGNFARLTGRTKHAEAARSDYQGAFNRLVRSGTMVSKIEANRFKTAAEYPMATQRVWAKSAAAQYSLSSDNVSSRKMRSVVRSYDEVPMRDLSEKRASNDPEAEKLADDYALYQLSALHRIAAISGNFPLTTRLSVCQNYVD